MAKLTILITIIGMACATGCGSKKTESTPPKTTKPSKETKKAATPDKKPAAKKAATSDKKPVVKPAGIQAKAKPATASKAAPIKLAGKSYGGGITSPTVVSISKILKNPEAYEGKSVRIEGMITDVCPKRGCWFEMKGEEAFQIMRFKVRDGVMVFPLDAKGKHAVAEGVVRLRKMTLEQSKKWAEYQAKNYKKNIDPSKITKPMTIVRLDGKGAVIRDKK
jgi:hypothetical protein